MTSPSPSPVVSGVPAWRARTGACVRAVQLTLRRRRPGTAISAARELLAGVALRRGFPLPPRRVRVAGRTYIDVTIPGWPSPSFDRFVEGELERIAPTRSGPPPLHLAFLGVTRLCTLCCVHCSEGDLLRRGEALSIEDLVAISRELSSLGVVHLELTGGEPLLRIEAVEAVSRALGPPVDVWVLTSGLNLDARAAVRLRSAGVVGVAVSLDHWDAARHDAFRGRTGLFETALAAAKEAASADLVVALSLTTTRETRADDLYRYLRLAREVGAGFVRVLEPRSAGRWVGQDVALRPDQVTMLLDFARAVNAEHSDLPIVELPALTQRTVGCFGAGDRYFFVDAEGFAHACPFCRGRVGTVLGGELTSTLSRLRERGCHAFPGAAAAVLREAIRAREVEGDEEETGRARHRFLRL